MIWPASDGGPYIGIDIHPPRWGRVLYGDEDIFTESFYMIPEEHRVPGGSTSLTKEQLAPMREAYKDFVKRAKGRFTLSTTFTTTPRSSRLSFGATPSFPTPLFPTPLFPTPFLATLKRVLRPRIGPVALLAFLFAFFGPCDSGSSKKDVAPPPDNTPADGCTKAFNGGCGDVLPPPIP